MKEISRHRTLALTAAGLVLGLTALVPAIALNSIASGFDANTLPANDDGSTSQVSTGFAMNFFGTTYNGLWVNNNGNVTFATAMSAYTPFGLTSALNNPIIAPFFADVDTRGTGSGLVSYGTGTFDGMSAFGVNWPNVGYYASHTDKLDNFQLLLVNRSDTGAGNFDIYFNYGSMQWETGDASGGSGGLGGSCAVAGYSNGTGTAGTYYQLPGSGVCGSLIDGGSHQLQTATNDGTAGQFLFEVRNGHVAPPPAGVPEPSSIALIGVGLGLLSLAAARRGRRHRH